MIWLEVLSKLATSLLFTSKTSPQLYLLALDWNQACTVNRRTENQAGQYLYNGHIMENNHVEKPHQHGTKRLNRRKNANDSDHEYIHNPSIPATLYERQGMQYAAEQRQEGPHLKKRYD